MSMLRSVQQNMPNMPNVSNTISSILTYPNQRNEQQNLSISNGIEKAYSLGSKP